MTIQGFSDSLFPARRIIMFDFRMFLSAEERVLHFGSNGLFVSGGFAICREFV